MEYDLCVIGAGPAGYVCAIKAAQNGLKVICIDGNSGLGGTCLNVGCIPSKMLLHTSAQYHHCLNAGAMGINIGSVSLDFAKVQKIKQSRVDKLQHGIENLFKKNKVEFLNAYAQFTSSNEVEAGGRKITAKNFVIAVGSSVSTLPHVEIDEQRIISSTGALSLKSVPKSLTIIGGGYIGVEMAFIFSRFGSKVTIIDYAKTILSAFDADVCAVAQKSLTELGVKFEMNKSVLSASVEKKGKAAAVRYCDNETGKEKEIVSDFALVAVGRKPNIDGLNLHNIGGSDVSIETDERGFIKINEKMQTSVEHIYAIGDIVGGTMLAHKASEEGVFVANLCANKYSHTNYDVIPAVVYSSPEIAVVGKTQLSLDAAGIAYNVGKFSFSSTSRAVVCGEAMGFVKIIAEKSSNKILGCQIIGEHAGEMIHEIAMAMEFGATAEDVALMCHSHPTFSEAIKEAALATFSHPIHG